MKKEKSSNVGVEYRFCFCRWTNSINSGVPRRGLGGLEPLPLAYDLRNKRIRMRQNMVFSTKICKIFCGGVTVPPDPSPVGTPSYPCPNPFGACCTSTPPILKSWVRHWASKHRCIHCVNCSFISSRRRGILQRGGRSKSRWVSLTVFQWVVVEWPIMNEWMVLQPARHEAYTGLAPAASHNMLGVIYERVNGSRSNSALPANSQVVIVQPHLSTFARHGSPPIASYRVDQKRKPTGFSTRTCSRRETLADFQNHLTGTLGNKFTIVLIQRNLLQAAMLTN